MWAKQTSKIKQIVNVKSLLVFADMTKRILYFPNSICLSKKKETFSNRDKLKAEHITNTVKYCLWGCVQGPPDGPDNLNHIASPMWCTESFT